MPKKHLIHKKHLIRAPHYNVIMGPNLPSILTLPEWAPIEARAMRRERRRRKNNSRRRFFDDLWSAASWPSSNWGQQLKKTPPGIGNAWPLNASLRSNSRLFSTEKHRAKKHLIHKNYNFGPQWLQFMKTIPIIGPQCLQSIKAIP